MKLPFLPEISLRIWIITILPLYITKRVHCFIFAETFPFSLPLLHRCFPFSLPPSPSLLLGSVFLRLLGFSQECFLQSCLTLYTALSATLASPPPPTMVVGKNKRISKGKKGGKKKAADPFAKKDWYDIKAPSIFNNKQVGKTLVTRTQGTKIASEGLKHRVFETSLADLQGDEEHAFRKMRLRAEDVQGRVVLTNFWGMNFTTDKLRSLVRKWQTLMEAHAVLNLE